MIKKNKVLAYIINEDKLLVFSEPDYPECGIQVPGGTVEENEDLLSAVIREVKEETGLINFKVIKFLGQSEKNMNEFGKNEIHIRNFFQIETEEKTGEVWEHIEKFPSEGQKEILFKFEWLDFENAKTVLKTHGDFIYLIQSDF